jgi:hypothetical protein
MNQPYYIGCLDSSKTLYAAFCRLSKKIQAGITGIGRIHRKLEDGYCSTCFIISGWFEKAEFGIPASLWVEGGWKLSHPRINNDGSHFACDYLRNQNSAGSSERRIFISKQKVFI